MTNTDTRTPVVAAGPATSVRVTPVVLDATERKIEKGTKNVLALLGDEIVVLTRVEVKSRRFVLRTSEDTVARKANTVKVLRAHGRFVVAGSATAAKIIAAHEAKIAEREAAKIAE